MKRPVLFLLLIGTFFFTGIASGIYIAIYHVSFLDFLRAFHHVFSPLLVTSDIPKYTGLTAEEGATDVESLIRIHSYSGATIQRDSLLAFIWKGKGLPKRDTFEFMEKSIRDSEYDSLKNLDTINKYTVVMEFGVNSLLYHFIPKSGNNRLMLVHAGHSGPFELNAISHFLAKGYSVIAFSMPLTEKNNRPVLHLESQGVIRLVSHSQFALLDSKKFCSIRFFLEPVITAINYAKKTNHYASISMVGLSGGAWTATLCAAIDPRIDFSYPVAGTYPTYLAQYELGDYEYALPGLYQNANYLELYILGALESHRHQLQILNQYDPCCYWGIGFKTYLGPVQNRLLSIRGGDFDVLLDSSHREHKISEFVLSRIDKDQKLKVRTNL